MFIKLAFIPTLELQKFLCDQQFDAVVFGGFEGCDRRLILLPVEPNVFARCRIGHFSQPQPIYSHPKIITADHYPIAAQAIDYRHTWIEVQIADGIVSPWRWVVVGGRVNGRVPIAVVAIAKQPQHCGFEGRDRTRCHLLNFVQRLGEPRQCFRG